MSRSKAITALDIGSDTIKILGVQKGSENGMEVMFFDKVNSFGVQKGRVKDPAEVGKKIRELIEKVEKRNDCKIENIFANINGSKLQLISSHGLISVARADQKVSNEDIERIYQEAETINLQSSNKVILDVFPKEWSLDGEREIRDPVGLQGVRLELDANLLSVFSSDIDSIVDSLSVAGFDIDYENIITGIIADAEAVLTPSQKELGVALINIGAGTLSVAVFEEGRLLNLAVFPVGSGSITNDIAIGFKTEIDVAERIKKEHGTLVEKAGRKMINFSLSPFGEEDEEEHFTIALQEGGKKKKPDKAKDNSNVLSFSEKDLEKIVEARVSEMFDLVSGELKKISKFGLLPAGIVITGGGSKLPGIAEFGKKAFKLPCRIGYPADFRGLDKDSSLSTVCGLIMSKIDKEDIKIGGSGTGIGKKIKGFFENFVP
jgi:cell division protein FtsA